MGLLLPATAPDLGHRVALLGHSCAVAAWHSPPLPRPRTWGNSSQPRLSAPVTGVNGTIVLPLRKSLVQITWLEYICISLRVFCFPGGSDSKESACNAGDPGLIPQSGRVLGEENGYHSSILARRIPWKEESDRLQSKGSQKVKRDWVTNTFMFKSFSVPNETRANSN